MEAPTIDLPASPGEDSLNRHAPPSKIKVASWADEDRFGGGCHACWGIGAAAIRPRRLLERGEVLTPLKQDWAERKGT